MPLPEHAFARSAEAKTLPSWRTSAGWNVFDRFAAEFLGLDRSKFEWAEVERELMERQELEDIANNNIKAAAQSEQLELGQAGAASTSNRMLSMASAEPMQRP